MSKCMGPANSLIGTCVVNFLARQKVVLEIRRRASSSFQTLNKGKLHSIELREYICDWHHRATYSAHALIHQQYPVSFPCKRGAEACKAVEIDSEIC